MVPVRTLKTIMNMDKYVCDVCGYIYDPAVGDPDNGIEPGTAFEDLPEDWLCPLCGVGKDEFSKVDCLRLSIGSRPTAGDPIYRAADRRSFCCGMRIVQYGLLQHSADDLRQFSDHLQHSADDLQQFSDHLQHSADYHRRLVPIDTSPRAYCYVASCLLIRGLVTSVTSRRRCLRCRQMR